MADKKGSGNSLASIISKVLIVAVAIAAAALAIHSRQAGGPVVPDSLPALIVLGDGKSDDCKRMAAVVAELRRDCAGKMEVSAIDIGPDTSGKFKAAILPALIFCDANGKQLSRHEGFLSKAAIMDKWKELGVLFAEPGDGAGQVQPSPAAANS